MFRCSSRRWRRRIRPVLVAVAAVAVVGCSDNEKCSTEPCPVPDAAPPPTDGAQPAKPDTAPPTAACKKDEVTCSGDELNAFGICLPASSMAEVPAGGFAMGFPGEGKDYAPAHAVSLKAFLIDKTEVTVAAYKACVDCGACTAPLREGSHTGREPYYGNPEYEGYPVIHVTWKDAKTYCEAIGKRLPTEAEWEKAAHGKAAQAYPWGDSNPIGTKQANYGGLTNDTAPTDGASQGASPFGALNMAGNVWEWVNDTYAADYYSKSPEADPPGPNEGAIKVVRGGGFLSSGDQIKTYHRNKYAQSAAYSYLGFRCAKDGQ